MAGEIDGFVYFVRGMPDGPIKIGFTTGHPLRRLAQLQAYSPARLRLLGLTTGGERQERKVHEKFADLRLHGEWFEPADQLLRWIRDNVRLWESVSTRPASAEIMKCWSPEDWRYEELRRIGEYRRAHSLGGPFRKSGDSLQTAPSFAV